MIRNLFFAVLLSLFVAMCARTQTSTNQSFVTLIPTGCTASKYQFNVAFFCPPATQPVYLKIPTGCSTVIKKSVVVFNCPMSQPLVPLSLTTPITVPQAKVGTTYSVNLAALANATGGTPPYKFALVPNPSLSWLSLSSIGMLTGTPTTAGTFNFSYTVTDSGATSSRKSSSASGRVK